MTEQLPSVGVSDLFSDVDNSRQPTHFVQYLKGVSDDAWLLELKQHSYRLLEAQEGKHFLDVGCGIGDDVRALAQLIGSSGRSIGIDKSITMLEECQHRSSGSMHGEEFVHGDVHHLPFADATFDGCRAERVLQHCEDPRLALSEMVRVVRPGGLVVVIDLDLDTVITNMQSLSSSRTLTALRCNFAKHGWIGRQLPGLFHLCGLEDIRVSPTVLCTMDTEGEDTDAIYWLQRAVHAQLLSPEDAALIQDEIKATREQKTAFTFGVFFSVVGRKPLLSFPEEKGGSHDE